LLALSDSPKMKRVLSSIQKMKRSPAVKSPRCGSIGIGTRRRRREAVRAAAGTIYTGSRAAA
jgi:hypothetical protein